MPSDAVATGAVQDVPGMLHQSRIESYGRKILCDIKVDSKRVLVVEEEKEKGEMAYTGRRRKKAARKRNQEKTVKLNAPPAV